MESRCFACQHKSKAVCKLSKLDSEELSQGSISVSFKKGDYIIRQGLFTSNIAFLKIGLVKTQIEGPYFTQMINITKPGNYLGLPTTLGDKLNSYSVVAVEDSEVCFTDRSTFKKLLSKNPDFSFQIILDLCKSELKSYDNCIRRTQKQIRGKVADVILDFANNIYKSDKFILNINQEEMGNLIDASRESISRVLNEFAKEEVINISGKKLEILNKDHLKLISLKG